MFGLQGFPRFIGWFPSIFGGFPYFLVRSHEFLVVSQNVLVQLYWYPIYKSTHHNPTIFLKQHTKSVLRRILEIASPRERQTPSPK